MQCGYATLPCTMPASSIFFFCPFITTL
jgi:hypothetical protein